MKLAVPGEFAGIVEEIAPGENTFEDNGAVYSTLIGVPVIDKARRTLGINPVKQVKPLEKGDIVIAVVSDLYDQIAQVKIIEVEGTSRTSLASKSVFIRISELQRGYVDFLRDHIRVGDVLKGKIIEVNDLGTYLTIAYPEYGVLSARCSHCRAEMNKNGSNFTCPECGSKETRKTIITNST
ncbi:MAG: exosome complex RNA-binding protein Csl4 [Candidatus Micrarchaeota archaeon]